MARLRDVVFDCRHPASLARFWDASKVAAISDNTVCSPALSELSPENRLDSNPRRPNVNLWPVAALIERDWSYTRREGDFLELLFDLRKDAGERLNRANDPAVRPALERMRRALGQLTAGPLTPDRFNP